MAADHAAGTHRAGDDSRHVYLSPDNKIMAAEVNGRGTTFQVGTTRPLFEAPRIVSSFYAYAVSPDGQRFLVNLRMDSPGLLKD
jgi:hypothetical protein